MKSGKRSFVRAILIGCVSMTPPVLWGNAFTISTTLPSDLQSASSVFSKYVEVFGLRILATSSVSDDKVLHTANVLAEYLDNDENGEVDQPEILTSLTGSSQSTISTMVLFASESEQNSLDSSLASLETIMTRTQNLFAEEIFENGSQGENRDATLEEVLHLVTDKGWDEAFPSVWGEKKGSSIANAMDSARGGYFETIPTSYPANAWYTYYDQTSDYPTQVTEYVYWATTTYLGGQNWSGRVHSDFTSEWKPITQADLNSTDSAVISLLTSSSYKFPITQLPDGDYSVPSIRASASTTTASGWKNSSWFGYFYDPGNNWIYHQTLGWLYPVDSGPGETWLYHSHYGWMWTHSEHYPWVYLKDFSRWIYYLPANGFYDASTKKWLSQPELISQIKTHSSYYSSGQLTTDPNISAWFDRSLEVYGVKLVMAGEVGGQIAVPEEWAKKVAQTVKLLINPTASNVNISYQEEMIKVLRGDSGTWHADLPTVQRIAYGGGADYSPNPLLDAGSAQYSGYHEFLNLHMANDMIWYKINSDGTVNNIGNVDIGEVLEHLMHTIHILGLPGAVPGSQTALQWDPENHSGWQKSELYLAMKEAVENGVFSLADYGDGSIDSEETYRVATKEYLYLLNFGMWEFGTEIWQGGSLAPEWNDNARTPAGVQQNNPLGYALFSKYMDPVLSKPSLETLRSIFQDNDQGVSGYQSD
jgi:hypothetical protein